MTKRYCTIPSLPLTSTRLASTWSVPASNSLYGRPDRDTAQRRGLANTGSRTDPGTQCWLRSMQITVRSRPTGARAARCHTFRVAKCPHTRTRTPLLRAPGPVETPVDEARSLPPHPDVCRAAQRREHNETAGQPCYDLPCRRPRRPRQRPRGMASTRVEVLA